MSHPVSLPQQLQQVVSKGPASALHGTLSTQPRMSFTVDGSTAVREVEGLLTSTECTHLIMAASAKGFTAPGFNEEKRRCTRLHTVDRALSDAMMPRLRPFLPELVVVDGPRWRPSRFTHHWRYVRYEAGGHFAPHYDGAKMLPGREMTVFTVQVYLNDDFEGGSTRFYMDHHAERHATREIPYGTVSSFSPAGAPTHRVTPSTGKALVFNHAENTLHDGEPVKSGVKYILRTDVLYTLVDEDLPILLGESDPSQRMWCEKTAAMKGTRNYVGETWRCMCGDDSCGAH